MADDSSVPVFEREVPAGTDVGGFAVEPKVYHKFMSHPRGNEFPIPVWELSNDVITSLRHKYVIGEDKSSEDVKLLLGKSLEDNLDSIAAKEGFTFMIPKAEKKFMKYDETTGISFLSCSQDDYITRSFNDGRTRNTATRTAWATQMLHANLQAGISITKRDLMYGNKQLFPNQDTSDKTLTDLCFMHGCRMRSLNVLTRQKGIILGNVIIRLKSGVEYNCSEGTQIPNDIRKIQDVLIIGAKQIQYVLVVEKYTMLHYLEQMNFHNMFNCIIVTGCGMAGLATREFLHLLKKITGLPFYGLADPDPSGAKIMYTYARGSIGSAYDNFNVAVPTLRWIGVFISKFRSLDIPKGCFKSFDKKDKSTLDSLLNDQNMSEVWLQKLQEMKNIGLKASFEDFKYISIPYFAHELLPELIKDASKEEEEEEEEEEE